MSTDTESPLDYAQPPGGAAPPPPRKPGDSGGEGSVLLGIGLGTILHVVIVGGSMLVGWGFLFGVIGLIQLVYVVPAWIVLRVKGMKRTALGVVILAAVTFLLNSGCWGLFALLYGGLH